VRFRRLVPLLVPLTLCGSLVAGACSSGKDDSAAKPTAKAPTTSATTTAPGSDVAGQIPGMPPVTDAANVYSETTAGKMSPAVAGAKQYVYVPDNDDGQVWVIDQASYAVVGKYPVGSLVQHVVPSHDLKTLYANASGSSQLVPFDPATGTPGKPIPVDAPYNLYFTPDGRSAMVMAERRNRIDFYDPTTWQRTRSVDVPCTGRGGQKTGGVNHADWSADGTYFLATCEFAGRLLKVDTLSGAILGTLDLAKGDMPQDCRVTPDGRTFYVADMMAGGVHVIDGPSFTETSFIPTGDGAHGIYPSRDTTVAYVSNRGHSGTKKPGAGTISVIDFATNKVTATWTIPGGGSPDMGGVSADGTRLWLSGRYDNVVYVFDTTTGQMIKKIPVGKGPHGLAVFPQPGRYSLGHTGNYR
jgi:YVTN family beta-propeller protein